MIPEDEEAATPWRLGPVDTAEADERRSSTAVLRCMRNGRRWRIELGRRITYVGHSVGMLHLAVLIDHPAMEVSALELASGVPGQHRRDAPASTQAFVDDITLRAYRLRIGQLQAELDGEADLDPQRAQQLREVAAWLSGELARSVTPPRPITSLLEDTERARVAVSKAIRRAISRITRNDPVLGEHLLNTVHTGVQCWYRPPTSDYRHGPLLG